MKFKHSAIALLLSAVILLGSACSQNTGEPEISDTENRVSDSVMENTVSETEKPKETTQNTSASTEAITTPKTEESSTEPEKTAETTSTAVQTEEPKETTTVSTKAETTTAVQTTAMSDTTAAATAAATTTAAATAAAAAAPANNENKTMQIDALPLSSKVETLINAMGAGWNLGNQMEASISGVPSETAWGNPVITEALIKAVKAQGFKTVRIPVSYLLKIGEGPDYTIDEAWLTRVKEVVDYVINNDLYAIINIHGDGYYTVDKSWLLCAETLKNKQK